MRDHDFDIRLLKDGFAHRYSLDRLLQLCRKQESYLVGGAIRDALLGRTVKDLDLVFPVDPSELARTFARQIDGHWFWLDEARRQSRVVGTRDPVPHHVDFAPFRANDLTADLLDRDFTINAMAIRFADDEPCPPLIDPFAGATDLHQGALRMVSREAFVNDPLRILKGVRHATTLDLAIEAATLQAMHVQANVLPDMAPERIRRELWKILVDVNARRGLDLLALSGVGRALIHPDYDVSVPALQGELETCCALWQAMTDRCPVVHDWLESEVEQGLSCRGLLLWSILLQHLDQDLPLSLARAWLFSRKAEANVAAILALDRSTLEAFQALANNVRAYSWFASGRRIDPGLLLPALAILYARQGLPLSAVLAWVPLVERATTRPKDLVSGRWLRDELGLAEGPEIARMLGLLRQAEMAGQVSDPEEARRFLRRQARDKD